MRMSVIFFVILGLFSLILTWLITCYNQIIKTKNYMEDAWSGIDVQLKRRFDLIPQLVTVVNRYSQHETDTLDRIIKLRQNTTDDSSKKQKQKDEQDLSQYLHRLFVQIEAYPELLSNKNFLHLQQQLSDIENDIQLARRYFNGTVRNYNSLIQSFPNFLVARHYGFAEAEYFELESSEEADMPKV